MDKIILSCCDTIPGYEITETLGVVKGNTIRAKHIGRDIMAGLKQIVGGEIKGYTEMFREARLEAEARMMEDAKELGADAVLTVRYTTSAIMLNASEILVYGTAVKVKKNG